MNSQKLCEYINSKGISFFTGVPDSTLSSIFSILETDNRYHFVPAIREDVAVGLAVGAYIGGRKSLILMQNSGLGYCINAFTSLAQLYQVPILVMIGWRGYDECDSVEHCIMGRSTLSLLKSIGMPHVILELLHAKEQVTWAYDTMIEQQAPVAIIVPPKLFE